MSLIARWDASNSVRYCAHCESEQGAGIGDPGDRACAACGQHDAPHVYVPLATYEGAVEALERAERMAELWKRSPDVQVKRCGADLAAVLVPLPPLTGGQ